jgi:hypothetical protein
MYILVKQLHLLEFLNKPQDHKELFKYIEQKNSIERKGTIEQKSAITQKSNIEQKDI